MKDDLEIRRVWVTFVPHILTEDQIENRKSIVDELFERSPNKNYILSKVVTGDENWGFAYNPHIKPVTRMAHNNVHN